MASTLLSLGLEIIALHVLGFAAACHAIMNTRTSQGAIAWAVALVSVPYLTLIPYLFLGRSRFAGYVDEHRFNRARALARSTASEADRASWQTTIQSRRHAECDPVLHRFFAIERLLGKFFLQGNAVRLLKDGEATFAAIFAAIAEARHYVLVQFFVVRNDALGRSLQQALLDATARGVKVHFLYDGIGSHALDRKFIGALRAGGVEINAFAVRRFRNRFQLNFRNHRKIVAVDGRLAFIGGHNVGVEYLGAKAPLSPWRDTHIAVEGPAVAQIERTFSEDWYWVTQRLPELRSPRADAGDMCCLAVPSGPADLRETCSLYFVQVIHAAQRRIWISSPYFVPDAAVQAALQLAVLRGVDVRVLMPSRPDHFTVFQASCHNAYEAVRAGVKIYRYRPGFIHQKVLLVDDDVAGVGSANLDNRSFRLNFELGLLVVSHAFAADVEAMLQDDFALAEQVAPSEYAQVSILRRIVMHYARLFAPIL